MKRIEELIRIIYHRATILNGTPYENDDPLCKAEAEILSRFSELERKIANHKKEKDEAVKIEQNEIRRLSFWREINEKH